MCRSDIEDPGWKTKKSFPAPEAVASLVVDLHWRTVYILDEASTGKLFILSPDC